MYLVPRTPYLILRASYLVPRASYLAPRTPHLVPHTSYHVPGSQFQANQGEKHYLNIRMRNRTVKVYKAPRHPTLRGSSNPTCVCIVCMYVQSESSFCFLWLLAVKIITGDILQPPPATPLAGGFQSSLRYAICTKILSLLFICALE